MCLPKQNLLRKVLSRTDNPFIDNATVFVNIVDSSKKTLGLYQRCSPQ